MTAKPHDATDVGEHRIHAFRFGLRLGLGLGGHGYAQRLAGQALGLGVPFSVSWGTMLEGAAGTMASAQLFSTFDSLKWGTELFGPLLLTEEILVEPLRYQDFKLHLPATPGLGITFDWARIERMRRDAR